LGFSKIIGKPRMMPKLFAMRSLILKERYERYNWIHSIIMANSNPVMIRNNNFLVGFLERGLDNDSIANDRKGRKIIVWRR